MNISIDKLPSNERKVIYLLLLLGYSDLSRSKHQAILNKAAKQLGITLSRIKINTCSSSIYRFIFRFPRFKRDDVLANRIAEAIIYAANITYGPLIEFHESGLSFPIPSNLIRNSAEVDFDTLVDLEENRSLDLKILQFPTTSIGSTIFIDDVRVTAAWKITNLLFSRGNFLDAARYLKESQENFYVGPGQIEDVIFDSSSYFKTGWEQSRLEISLLNAFKVIEAIVGDLPSDDKKLIRKIQFLGIDPYRGFGIPPQRPLFEFLRDMNKARDRGSAHGSTPPQKILVRDMFLFQDCARYFLQEVLENELGEDLYAN